MTNTKRCVWCGIKDVAYYPLEDGECPQCRALRQRIEPDTPVVRRMVDVAYDPELDGPETLTVGPLPDRMSKRRHDFLKRYPTSILHKFATADDPTAAYEVEIALDFIRGAVP